MTPYTVAPLARNDLDEIWMYVAKDNRMAANQLIEEFYRKFLLLASQPLMGESREELASGLRSFSCGNYLFLYHLSEHGIEVARVIHATRDLGAQFCSSQ